MAAKVDERILYDLLVPLEWPTEREDLPHEEFPSLWKTLLALVKGWGNLLSRAVQYPFSSRHGHGIIPSLVVSAVNARIPWRLCLNHHGDHLAVVKDDYVELWCTCGEKDFLVAAGNCAIVRDPNPQWRSVCWSSQDTWLAVGNSNGELFVVGKNGALLGRLKVEAVEGAGLALAYAGLMFVPAENFGEGMSGDVLVTVRYDGELGCYKISEQLTLLHSFSLCQHHPGGVGAVLYHSALRTLVVAGWGDREDTSAISCWRMLNGAPYYAVASGTTDTKNSPGFLGLLKGRRQRGTGKGGVFHMALSPDGQLLASVDGAGRLSVWEVPSGRLRHSWDLQQQPRPTEPHDTMTATQQRRGKVPDCVPVDVNWWTEDALIIAYSSGDVVVAGLEDLTNHLGANPEKCEPGCVVTQATRGGFFILECQSEARVRPSAFTALISSSTAEGEGEGEGAEQTGGEEGPRQTASQLMKQVLYYMTDLERFRPPQKAARCIHRTHRLLAIQSTTPEELYERKLRLEEYGEALSLARVYGLDCDVVYQRQWERTPTSAASIRNYLAKVNKVHWVLRECLSCVPDSFDVTRSLLMYGVSKTEFSQLVGAQGDREGLLSLEEEQEENGDEDNPDEIRRRILSWGSLSEEQKFLCQCRLRLLVMLDRLSCYERILGGPRYVDDRYQSEEFRWFREENAVRLAANYARMGDADSVGVLLSIFGKAALPHWLAIISNFPETTPPGDYRHILPQMSAEGEMLPWGQEVLREADWCEDPQIMELFDVTPEELARGESGDFLYWEQPEWENYRGVLTADLLTLWYSERTMEIEHLSGQVDNALALVELGIEYQVPGLEVVHHDFQTLHTLVYHCHVDPTLSLPHLRRMSNLEKVQAMMRKVDVQHFQESFVSHVHPFLCRTEAVVPGASGQVLEDFLVQVAAEDLEPCLAVLQLLTDKDSTMKVISEDSEVLCLALHCIYASLRSDQLPVAEKILDCQPKRSSKDTEGLSLLHDEVDQLRSLLEAAWLLSVNDVKKPLSTLKSLQDDPKAVEQLFVQFTRTAGRQGQLSAMQWKDVLGDLLDMRQTVFQCVAESSCYEIFALSLMCSGHSDDIELGSQLLTCPFPFPIQPQPSWSGSRSSSSVVTSDVFSYRLPEAKSAQLVLTAASEYTNAAASPSDSEIALAKKCLQLLGNSTKGAVTELNLIRVYEVLDSLGLSMIPLKLRICENKLDIIKDLLSVSPQVYKQHRKVLEVSRLLGLDTTEYDEDASISQGMGETLILLIRAGLEQNDITVAVKLCQEVMHVRLSTGWKVCRDVALSGSVQEPSIRLSLLEFSALHCPLDELQAVLHAHNLVEVEVLCSDLTGDPKSGVVQGFLGRGADRVEQLWAQGSDSVQWVMRYRPSLTQAVSLVKSAAKVIPPLGYSPLRGYSVLKGYSPSTDPAGTSDTAAAAEGEQVQSVQDTGTDDTFEVVPSTHVFYETTGSGDIGQVKKSYLTGHYLDLEKGVTVSQCSLRAQWVTEEKETKEDSKLCDTLMLLKVTEEVLHRDCPLALSFLLALPDSVSAEPLLDHVRRSRFSLQFILYFLALELNTQIPLQSDGKKTVALFEEAGTLIASAIKHVTSHDFSDQSDKVQKLVDLFKKYHKRLVELEQAEVLRALDMGIEVDRFAREADYRQQVILSLARSMKDEVFATCLSLAASYDMGEWQVYTTHLRWLLTDSRLSALKVKKRVAEMKLVEKLVSKPEETAAVLRTEVYPLMDGKNFDLLRVFFTVLKSCSRGEAEGEEGSKAVEPNPETHLRLLQELKSPLKGLNYKSLMSGEDPLGVLSPFLTASSIHTVANMASNIPSSTGGYLTPSELYRHFAEKLFWEEREEVKSEEQEQGSILVRYKKCHEYLVLLDASDLLEFLKEISVTRRALHLPRASRIGILQQGVELARSQATAQVTDSEGEAPKEQGEEEHTRMTFASVAGELVTCLKHLQALENHIDVLEEMLPEWGLSQFETSLSQSAHLEQLSMEMVARGCNLVAMDTVLKCGLEVQPHALRTSEIVIRALLRALDSLSNDSLSVVEAICVTCVNDGDRYVSLGEVVDVLVRFAEDWSKPAGLRLAVLAIIRKVLPHSLDPTLLLLHQTRVLVEGHFDEEVKPEALGSQDGRGTLFSALLSVATSADQLTTLAQLLKLWPTSRDTQSQWGSLLEATVEHKEARHMVPLLRAGLDTIPVKTDAQLYSRLLDEGQSVLACKFAFITASTDLHQKALDCISHMSEQDVLATAEDGSLFELLVLRKALPSIVNTPLFTYLHKSMAKCPEVDLKLFSVLLECEESEVIAKLSLDNVRSHAQVAAKQLYEAGYWLEAGSVLMSAAPHYHPGLQTLNTAYSLMTALFHK